MPLSAADLIEIFSSKNIHRRLTKSSNDPCLHHDNIFTGTLTAKIHITRRYHVPPTAVAGPTPLNAPTKNPRTRDRAPTRIERGSQAPLARYACTDSIERGDNDDEDETW